MNETAKEWMEKANGDYHTAKREIHVKKSPNYDAVCFHANNALDACERIHENLLESIGNEKES